MPYKSTSNFYVWAFQLSLSRSRFSYPAQNKGLPPFYAATLNSASISAASAAERCYPLRKIASATRIPSAAAEMIPPAYPAPSPAG